MLALSLDGIILAIALLIFAPRLTGLGVHEWLGIALCIPVLLHLLLSWQWISNALRTFWTARRRARVNLILNAILFVLIVIEIVSGVVISRVALPFFGVTTINDRAWRLLHNLSANWTLASIGVHIAMNWRLILSSLRVLPRSEFPHAIRRSMLIVIAAAFVGLTALALIGRPALAREYVQDEIARFRPTLGHGVVQFTGEGMLLVGVAYVARRWLRVRL